MSAIGPTYPKMFIVMVCTIQTYHTQKLWYVLHLNSLSYKICVHRQLWFMCFEPACLISYSYCKPLVCMASMHKQLWYVWTVPAFYVSYKIFNGTKHKNYDMYSIWILCLIKFGPACLVSYSYCKPQVCMASMHKQLWYVWIQLAFYVSYKIIGLIIGIIHLHGLVISKSWYIGTL